MDNSKLFSDKSSLYADSRPRYPAELFEYIATLLSSHDQAWDCATGNGQAAVGLAGHFSKIEASDVSKEQIRNGFKAENINYSVQAAEKTTFLDNQFDLVNVAQALHWFDYEQFWPEVARLLKPDGVFVAYSYIWPQINTAIDELLESKVKSVIEPYWATNNKLVWDEYRSLDLPFAPLATPEITLENHWNLNEYLNYLHSWSGTRRCMDDLGVGFFDAASDFFQAEWGNPEQKKSVKHPLTIIAGKAGWHSGS